MACVKPDGSLTALGRQVLAALAGHALEEAIQALQLPVYRVRSLARSLEEAGLVESVDGSYRLTPEGETKLAAPTED